MRTELRTSSSALMAGELVPLAQRSVPKDNHSKAVGKLRNNAKRAATVVGAVTMPVSRPVNLTKTILNKLQFGDLKVTVRLSTNLTTKNELFLTENL